MKFIQGTVNWGIIGCGDVCEVKSGPAFYKIAGSKLVAVMRRDAGKAKDFATRHGASRYYTNADDLINDNEINAVYIATPPSSHEAYALKALQAGKPVYIEKPVALDAASCKRMIEASKMHAVPAVVAHYRRGLPLFRKVKELIRSSAIGDIRIITVRLLQPPSTKMIINTEDNWRINPDVSGGGLFHDLAPHQLDILYWIFGEPKVITGRSLNQSKKYNAPDLTSLEGVFGDHICFQGLWSFSAPESSVAEECTIVGEKGMLSFSFFKNTPLNIKLDTNTEEIKFDAPQHIQQPFIEKVVKYFNGERKNPCSLEEAFIVMKMIDKAG
jgi:predicted dehydrogenase